MPKFSALLETITLWGTPIIHPCHVGSWASSGRLFSFSEASTKANKETFNKLYLIPQIVHLRPRFSRNKFRKSSKPTPLRRWQRIWPLNSCFTAEVKLFSVRKASPSFFTRLSMRATFRWSLGWSVAGMKAHFSLKRMRLTYAVTAHWS